MTASELLAFIMFLSLVFAFSFTIFSTNNFNVLKVESEDEARSAMLDAEADLRVVLLRLGIIGARIDSHTFTMRVNFVEKHILGSKRVNSVWFRFQRRITEIRSKLRA